MHNDIPLKYYDIADEYATEAAEQVAESERDALAHYFQLLLTRLANNEEISEEAQQEMAKGIVAYLSKEGRLPAVGVQRRQKIAGSAAGVGGHSGISGGICGFCGEINEQFAQRYYVDHRTHPLSPWPRGTRCRADGKALRPPRWPGSGPWGD